MKPVSPSECTSDGGPFPPALSAERQGRGAWNEERPRDRRSRHPGRNPALDPRSNPNVRPAATTSRDTLSAEEERELAQRIQRGDPSARDRLVLANLRLVHKIARKYRRDGISFDDLVQEGNLGLMRASRDFNPSVHDTRFSSYAAIWINAYLYRAVTSGPSVVRAPRHVVQLRKRLREALAGFKAEAGPDEGGPIDEPALERAAEELGVSLRRLKACERASREQAAPSPIGDEDGPASLAEELVDPRRPDEEAIEHEEQLLLGSALQNLNPVEAWLLRERFGLSTTIPEAREWDEPAPNAPRSAPDGRDTSDRADDQSGARRAYFHRTYRDLERECGLEPDRLHQIERDALAKLRHVLGPCLAPSP